MNGKLRAVAFTVVFAMVGWGGAAGAGEYPFPNGAPLDHYKCYRVKGETRVRDVTLGDQFRFTEARVTRAELLCNPVSKDSGEIYNYVNHLVCYRLNEEEVDEELQVFVANQFGEEILEVTEARLLCVPSLKFFVEGNGEGNGPVNNLAE